MSLWYNIKTQISITYFSQLFNKSKIQHLDFNGYTCIIFIIMRIFSALLLLQAFLITILRSRIIPTSEVKLYPNTEGSPSLYIISFTTNRNIRPEQYMLISLDWLTDPIDPHSCIFVNSTKEVQCANLDSPPPQFTLTFTTDALQNHNNQIDNQRMLVVLLKNGIQADTEYFFEFALYNQVQNMAQISPSMEIYLINKDGLVYEENLNFGPVVYKPPQTNLLDVSILTDLSQNSPGTLSTLKAEITISVPIKTPLSALWFTLQDPFQFSPSSYLRVDQSEDYATNPIALNAEPAVEYFQVKSPHIFYIVFNQKFAINRKFIIEITEIKNPFFIAESNISIYSSDFNSLTPLQAFESLYPLSTVTQALTVTLGLPHDMPLQGPCTFYRNYINYYKVTFNMPMTVPQGYAIKVIANRNSIRTGTGYVNFQSLDYTTKYEYFYNQDYFIMKGMGPIQEGSLIYILFKAYKDSITNFYVQVLIDTEEVIQAGTPGTDYMFDGRDEGQAQDASDFYYFIEDSTTYENQRLVIDLPTNQYIRMRLYVRNPTSTGSYLQVYMSPLVEFDPTFNENTDCRFNNSAGSAKCTVTKTSNYVHMKIQALPGSSWQSSVPNSFMQWRHVYIYIWKVKIFTPSSNKYPYQFYFRLFNSSGVNPTTYIQTITVSVLPQRSTGPGTSLQKIGNTYNTNLKLSGFLRFQSKTPLTFDYTLQQNEVRVISVRSYRGIRGLGSIANQAQYPCSSNIKVKCFYREGGAPNQIYYNWMIQWDSVDIYFEDGSTQTTENFQVIIPDDVNYASNNYYAALIGIYNTLTKDTKYLYRTSQYYENGAWRTTGFNSQAGMTIDFQGKAGSYRSNVTVSIAKGSNIQTGDYNFLVISSSWSLFENGISSYTTASQSLPYVTLYDTQLSPLSVKMGSGYYLTVIPFTVPTASASSFNIWLDSLHMPYHYDLPDCYIYLTENSNSDRMSAFQAFEMTNQDIFYEAFLKSLTISCEENFLGVENTICEVTFGTQSPLKADGVITLVFSGMDVATDECALILPSGAEVESSCQSTEDNKNVTIKLVDTYDDYHYPADNFTLRVHGVSIMATEISQSITVFLKDSTERYVIEKGTRILTTTVALPNYIQIEEITYDYLSPLSANKMSISFYLPRKIYDDERLGFIMGKDLSDVNMEVKRMRIVLTRSDGVELEATHELISEEYKVLFTFRDASLLIASNYTLEIYGIMTPASHDNGAFSIIFQRRFDKGFTLSNEISTSFPSFQDRISSNISMSALYNTEGYEQMLKFTITNNELPVNDENVWIVNFPSYYSENLFNSQPYCMIDTAPIKCQTDSTTPYQLIIKDSPKMIAAGVSYELSIHRLACPRAKYTNDQFRSRYLFIGMLENDNSQFYAETSLLYPYQIIEENVDGILTIIDVILSTTELPTFSSLVTTMTLKCNTDIPAGSFLFLIFPTNFDNFNNNPIDAIIKNSGNTVLSSGQMSVIDRKVEIPITTLITANSLFKIEFPSLPTPKIAGPVYMSEITGFLTPADMLSIFAATSTSGNSAPILTFTADDRYISFNHDNTIEITAGTYSHMIDITGSDGQEFLTNIEVNISAAGFTFEPERVFLQLGNQKGQFRVGADAGLLPISYFYETSKSEEVYTYYTITKNNNIKVTNTPVMVTIPSSISIPIGGCSQPVIVDINHPPVQDVGISFNYDNSIYTQGLFFPNSHTTKSQMLFTVEDTTNIMSFCISSDYVIGGDYANNFPVQLLFIGTNYRSYGFTPSNVLTINIIPPNASPPTPVISLQTINIQKTFLDFNLSTNIDGTIFYHLKEGYNQNPIGIVQLQIHLKNHQQILQSMDDYINHRIYTDQRDQRVGAKIQNAGQFTMRINDLLPERYYTFCAYLEDYYSVISQPDCITVQTQQWGTIMKAKVSFDSPLLPENLNKILCFFTKEIDTQARYVVDLQGNSCHDRQVSNLYFSYPGQSFTSENKHTVLFIITNPYISSDPSPVAFTNLYGANKELTPFALASAVSDFAINYMDSIYISSYEAIDFISQNNPQKLSVSFSQPEYDQANQRIIIHNSRVLGGYGSVYYLVVLYKEINIDGNNSYVNIILNERPTREQMLNCETWEGNPAAGCARSTYSYSAQTVTFDNILPDCMYIVYYAAASDYPLRPIMSSNIQNETVITFVGETYAKMPLLLVLVLMTISFLH